MPKARLPLLRRLASVTHMSPARIGLLVEASIELMIARVLLKTVPFPRLARDWGAFVPPSDVRAAAGLAPGDEDQAETAKNIRGAIDMGARNVPFGAVCLPQAMAARAMLKRRSIHSVMHFGAAKGEEKPIDAHAWLDAAGVKVTGYPVANGFVEIGCFVGGERAPAGENSASDGQFAA